MCYRPNVNIEYRGVRCASDRDTVPEIKSVFLAVSIFFVNKFMVSQVTQTAIGIQAPDLQRRFPTV